jgi:transcription initiation factor IIE alpha subunit
MKTVLMKKRAPGALYTCPQCGAKYPHDQAYRHALFLCQKKAAHG